MEINKETFKNVLNKGIDLTHYVILNYLNLNINVDDLKNIPKFAGVVSLMIRKELIIQLENGKLLITEKGKEMLSVFSNKEDKVDNLSSYTIEKVHTNVLNKLKELTNKTQVMAEVKGSRFPFMLTNIKDFKERLEKYCITKYKLTNLKKIEMCMINHIMNCHKSKNWTPLMKYYIFRENTGSPLANDYETLDEDTIENNKNALFDGVNI